MDAQVRRAVGYHSVPKGSQLPGREKARRRLECVPLTGKAARCTSPTATRHLEKKEQRFLRAGCGRDERTERGGRLGQ